MDILSENVPLYGNMGGPGLFEQHYHDAHQYFPVEFHTPGDQSHRQSFSAPYGFLKQEERRPSFGIAFLGPRVVPANPYFYGDASTPLLLSQVPLEPRPSLDEHFLTLGSGHDLSPLLPVKAEPRASWSTFFTDDSTPEEAPAPSKPRKASTKASGNRGTSKRRARKVPASKLSDDSDDQPAQPVEKESSWSCPVPGCGKSYRFKGDLKYHAKRKHPDLLDLPSTISKPRSAKEGKSFPCPVPTCSCGFKWARDLRRHVKTKHPESRDDEASTSSTDSVQQGQGRAQGDPHAFVTLSASSFYEDPASMLLLPNSTHIHERN